MTDAPTYSISPLMGGGNVPEWSVADRLRKAREWAGLDQVELARMIDGLAALPRAA